MNVDQLGHDAAQATRDAAHQMPLRPIDEIQGARRRRSWVAALAGIGTVVVAIVIAVSLAGPSDQQVATDPTGVPEPPSTTTTTTTTVATTTAAGGADSTKTAAAAMPIIPETGVSEPVAWFDGFAVGTGAPGFEAATLAQRQGENLGLKMIADDGAGGFVILAGGALEWWQA
ncbi:MAG: hypothetical protein OEM97_06750, partial [Acidimicrobiia bacterium]|nr:hypothetical protein [Acidimicrobiia bacterium]